MEEAWCLRTKSHTFFSTTKANCPSPASVRITLPLWSIKRGSELRPPAEKLSCQLLGRKSIRNAFETMCAWNFTGLGKREKKKSTWRQKNTNDGKYPHQFRQGESIYLDTFAKRKYAGVTAQIYIQLQWNTGCFQKYDGTLSFCINKELQNC